MGLPRWPLRISWFSFDVLQRAVIKNLPDDALSKIETIGTDTNHVDHDLGELMVKIVEQRR